MAKIMNSIEIKQPVEIVFAFWTDMTNRPRFSSAMREVELTSPGKTGIGQTFRGWGQAMGRKWYWNAVVTEFDRNAKFGTIIDSGNMTIEELDTISTNKDGSKLILTYELKTKGPIKMFKPILGLTLRMQTNQILKKLKTILES